VTPAHARVGDWIQTFTGKKFFPLDPRPEDVDIEDIAHSLSLQCRFTGHCKFFYSVAQHSVLVSQLLPWDAALWGLLHDASEAYLCDLPRPLKNRTALGVEYSRIETGLMTCIAEAFDLGPIPPMVKTADDIMLVTEASQIMGPCPEPWHVLGYKPRKEIIRSWPPNEAWGQFIQRFSLLRSGT
jgi:hypothetical protein